MNIPLDAFVLLSVGELNENKNNSVIIRALEKLNIPNIHYILCGIGEQEKALREQANEANLQNNIHFLGYRTDVKEIYAMSDCFVLPSYREGLSRSLMEAMASGLPCIVSKIRGNIDLINEDGGFLCEINDIGNFEDAINMLSEDILLREKMGCFNKIKIREFDVSVVQKGLINIYKDLL